MQLALTLVVAILALSSALPYKEPLAYYGSNNGADGKISIYHGNSTKITKHRYLVGILKDDEFYCAGSIVSMTWVITDGDCVKEIVTADELKIVGSSKDGVTGVTYNVSQIVRHPQYGKKKFDYDIVCLEIATHFYYGLKRSVRLPVVSPADDTVMTVAGYGFTDTSKTNRSLAEISMTLLPKSLCESTYKHYDFKFTDRMACAENTDGASLCYGDYGDAFVVDGVIYGIFIGSSSSGFCTDSASPAIMVDIYSVANWVHNVTGAEFANATSLL